MADTRLIYRQKVNQEVDDSSTAANLVINEAIQETYAELCQEVAPFINSKTTETGSVTSGTYVTTAEFEEIYSVQYMTSGDYKTLSPITREEYFDQVNVDSGEPNYCLKDDGNNLLTPAPTTGTIKIDGIAVVTELDSDTVSSVIPVRFRRVIVLGAIYRFLGYEKDPAAENYFVWYQQAKQQMLQQLSTQTPVVRPTLFGK